MPSTPANPGPRTPDEGDLLAFVEGEPLPREQERAVAAALAADPALARKLERMRADRSALRSMPAVAAPSGLLDAVESALQPVLERQMLLGLRDGRALEDHPPVSVVQPARRSVLGSLFAERAGRRMALAAGLLLVVGGASYFAATMIRPVSPARPLEIADAARRVSAPAGPSSPRIGRGPDQTAQRMLAERPVAADRSIAAAPTQAKALGGTANNASPSATLAQTKPEEPPFSPPPAPSQVASAPGLNPEDLGIDSARAVELAKQGRLVIRLRAPDPFVLSHPSVIADRVRRSSPAMWRLGDEAPPQLASLLHAAPPPVPEPIARPSAPSAPVVASDDLSKDMYGPPAPSLPRTAAPFTTQPVPTVYLVQTRLDAAAIDGLRGALAPYGEATLEESAQPLPLEDSLNPAAVVWWSQPPSGWTWWASVPIVIDQQP